MPSPNRLFSQLPQAAAGFLLAGLLLSAGLLGGAGTASAQSSPSASAEAESAPAQWRAHFDQQAARQLRKSPETRTDMLKVVIQQASSNEDLALPKTTTALLHVVEHGKSRKNRVMAVQALSKIAPEQIGEAQHERVMNRLYALGEKEGTSDRVRGAIADAIAGDQTG